MSIAAFWFLQFSSLAPAAERCEPLLVREGQSSANLYHNYAKEHAIEAFDYTPKRGYLKGIPIEFNEYAQAKIKLKHGVENSQVQKALDNWTEGAIEMPSFADQLRPENRRYYFVSAYDSNIQRGQRFASYMAVVLELDPDEKISLLTAYRVPARKYIGFKNSPKSLD